LIRLGLSIKSAAENLCMSNKNLALLIDGKKTQSSYGSELANYLKTTLKVLA
jgi:hypothetical protein